jgi:hypothetical protein
MAADTTGCLIRVHPRHPRFKVPVYARASNGERRTSNHPRWTLNVERWTFWQLAEMLFRVFREFRGFWFQFVRASGWKLPMNRSIFEVRTPIAD